MRIRFLSDQVYEIAGPDKGPRFAKGLVLDASEVPRALKLSSQPSPEWVDSWLNRWLQRGVAVDDEAQPADPGQPEKQPGEQQVQKLDLGTLTRGQLDALAKERGVDISTAKNKGDVIAALEQAAMFAGHE